MNDLRDRLQHLADDATDGVTLRHPRHLPSRHRSLRAWIAGLVATVLAGVAALGGGNLVLNTGSEGTEIHTVPPPVVTTVPTPPEPDDDIAVPGSDGDTRDDDDQVGSRPGVASRPDAPPPPPAPHALDTTGDPRPSTVAARWGELGPTVAVAPNDGTTGTAGSGCRPGTDRGLPDGVWMAEVTRFGATDIDLDLVCFTTDASAEASGRPILDDHELTNDSGLVRTLPLAPGVNFHLQTNSPFRAPGTPTRMLSFVDPAGARTFAAETPDPTPLAWVLVEGGRVTEVYSPPLQHA